MAEIKEEWSTTEDTKEETITEFEDNEDSVDEVVKDSTQESSNDSEQDIEEIQSTKTRRKEIQEKKNSM